MIIKFTGIILIIICSTMAGVMASDKLKGYYKNCILIEETANRIGIMIKYRSLDVYGISSELKKSEAFSELEFIKNLPDDFVEESFESVWNRAVNSDNSIGDEEKRALISFGETFGASDTQGQLSSIEMLIENLKNTEQKRRAEYEKKGRLYRCAGLLAGIMTGIMIL